MSQPELESKTASLAMSNGIHHPEPFGKSLLKHFSFAKGWRNLNHGSFGTYPASVRSALRSFQDIAELQPDTFQRYDQIGYLNKARTEVAALVKAPISTIVFIPNVTTGVHTMLRNLVYAPNDVILYFSTTYGACQKIVTSTTEVTPASSCRIPLSFPMTDDKLLDLFRETVASLRAQGKNPRVAIIDTIISMPGVRMPFERLLSTCKDLGIFSVVDGAHGIGQIALDLPKLDPDFFVSNCHKWLYTPRGCAIMYVPERNQALLRTSFPTSHYFVPAEAPEDGEAFNPLVPMAEGDTPYTKLFEFVGTLDISPYLCVPAALKFRKEYCGGEAQLMKYCADLARNGGALVAKSLGTETLDCENSSMTKDCAMINVRLPLVAPGSTSANGDVVKLGADGPGSVIHFVQRYLIDELDTFIAIMFYENSWWARLSGQAYLELSDFEFGATALSKACERVRAGDHLKGVKIAAP